MQPDRWEILASSSFRSGKYVSVGEGGALFSKHEQFNERLRRLIAALPVSNRKEEFLHVTKTFLRSTLRSRPFYGLVGYALWEAYNRKAEFLEKSPVVEGKVYKTDLAMIVQRLPLLDAQIKIQRRNADYLARTVNLGSTVLCREPSNASYNRYQYPLTFPSFFCRLSIAKAS